MRKILFIVGVTLLASCCSRSHNGKIEEITLSRALEKTIEVGEQVISERALIDNVALTEGTAAAVKLELELHHRQNYNEFWSHLDYTNELCCRIDSTRREAVIEQITPYLRRLETILEDFPEYTIIRPGSN